METLWIDGQIDAKYIANQIAMIDADLFSIDIHLCEIRIDPDFNELVREQSAVGNQRYVLSDGVDFAIHRLLLERFGGPAGVRDAGLLESDLHRLQTGHYAELAEMAAALIESLIMNHPFIDGNKRVVFFATDIFSLLSGYKLKVDAAKARRFLIGLLEQHRCTFDELLPWIRTCTVQL